MFNEDKLVLADKLKNLRKSFGMTQDDIAELLDMSRTSFSKYENSAAVPPLKVLRKLSAIYNVPLEYLIHDEQPGVLRFNSNNDNEIPEIDGDSLKYFTQLTHEEKILILKLRLMQSDKKKEIIDAIENNDE
ncbi:MAG: helix-turn-helix transcriptional regulator [Clostridia bacterium]|nr:helix-turn-helix transcriptional regulator [Clostridia bacterium]